MKPKLSIASRAMQRAIPTTRSRVEILAGLLALLLPVATTIALADNDSKAELQAEMTAMAFVRENHPELATLLAQLKTMKPEEYGKAVKELTQVSKSLATLKANNPRRHAAALETWKARSKVQLVAARLSYANASGGTAVAELESRLRQAVSSQVEAEIQQARVDKEIVEERARKLTENLAKLEARRDATVESRVENMLKQSRKARRAAARSDARITTKVNADAKSPTNADESANRLKEPRS